MSMISQLLGRDPEKSKKQREEKKEKLVARKAKKKHLKEQRMAKRRGKLPSESSAENK